MKRIVWVLLALVLLVGPVLWLAPPLYPYSPTCRIPQGFPLNWRERPVTGRVRPAAMTALLQQFSQDEVPHFKINGKIYMTWFSDFDYLNWETKYARSIASGWVEGGPPPAIDRLVARWESQHGQTLRRNERGAVDYDETQKLGDCALKSAALMEMDGD